MATNGMRGLVSSPPLPSSNHVSARRDSPAEMVNDLYASRAGPNRAESPAFFPASALSGSPGLRFDCLPGRSFPASDR